MSDLPLIARASNVAVITPAIPLNFVYPGLSFSQILSIIKAYRMLSFLIIITVASVTAMVIALLPRTYTATLTFIVNYEVNDPLNGKELPIGQVGSYIATQVELMQITEVLMEVVERLHLTKNREYTQGYRSDNGTLPEWVAMKLRKNLAIYQGQNGSQLIYVTYSANNPHEAAQVANMVAEVYLSTSLIRSLRSQLAGQKAKLNRLNIAFAPRHPEVLAMRSQINATRNALNNQLNNPAISIVTGTSVAIQEESTQAEYKISSAGNHGNVSIISHATPPVKPSKPKLFTWFLLGGFVSGALGLVLPLGYELFNRRVRCRDDIERHHGIPVLVEFGTLPLHVSTLPMRAGT